MNTHLKDLIKSLNLSGGVLPGLLLRRISEMLCNPKSKVRHAMPEASDEEIMTWLNGEQVSELVSAMKIAGRKRRLQIVRDAIEELYLENLSPKWLQ